MDGLVLLVTALLLSLGACSGVNTFSPFSLWLSDCLSRSKPEYAGSTCTEHLTSILDFVGAGLGPPYSFTADQLERLKSACQARPCLDITGDAFDTYIEGLTGEDGSCGTFPLAMSSPRTGVTQALFDFICLGGDARCLVSILHELKTLGMLKAFTSMYYGEKLEIPDEVELCKALETTKCCFRTWVHLSYALFQQSCRPAAALDMMALLRTCSDHGIVVQGVCSEWRRMPDNWLQQRTDCPDALMNSTAECLPSQRDTSQCFQNSCDIWCALNFAGQKAVPLPWKSQRTNQEYIGRVLLITSSVVLVVLFTLFFCIRFLLRREKRMMARTDSEDEVLSFASTHYSSKTTSKTSTRHTSRTSRGKSFGFRTPEALEGWTHKDEMSETCMGQALDYYANSFTAAARRQSPTRTAPEPEPCAEMATFSIKVGSTNNEPPANQTQPNGQVEQENRSNEESGEEPMH
ncbi:hypothetical protein BSKO_10380 [Bryopsis sp. KO-2023]|nr:hypothetical protein BSKO_10380 [Bryopsis sp. KO-2023]